jgi:ribosomal protein RSM22 (predicted rRNA methylase)
MRRPSRIHRGLTGERALVGTPYLADTELRRQYAAEIAPRTGAALAKILGELDHQDAPRPRRVLDLGAGTGAAGTAIRDAFGPEVELVAVDRVRPSGPYRAIVIADLERSLPAVSGRFDLVVAAHLLGELFLEQSFADQAAARAARVLAWWRALLAPDGTMILVEPALKETSRALLAVRDRVIAAGLRVVAPCSWTGPCPALARERDWCHDAAPGSAPGSPRIDFSYLVLRGGAQAAPAADVTSFRIVSDPLVEKGRLKLWGCGPAGRHPLVRLDRQASASNAAFDQLRRGDVATVAGTEVAGDGLRVVAEAVVRRGLFRSGP